MSTAALALFVSGALLELVGIVLVASPDLVPYARRLSAWLQVHVARVENSLRARLGLPRKSKTVRVNLASELNLAARMSGIVTTNPSGSLADKVDFLLRRDREAQERQNALEHRVANLEDDVAHKLDELERKMERHVSAELEGAERRYREVRVLGAVLVAIGLGCATAANFA